MHPHLYPNSFVDHLQLVEAVRQADVEPPRQWLELQQRFEQYAALQFPLRERLTAALIDDTNEDLALLKAAVLAEQLAQPGNQASAEVEAQVLHRLKQLYSEAAAKNIALIAKKFNEHARRFSDAADTVDVEGDAAAILNEPDKVRQAYQAAESYANQLTRLLPAIAAAAELCGAGNVGYDPTLLLPLVCDPGHAHRRRVWEAWNTKGNRCERWSALRALGIQIRAAASVDDLQPYALPRDVEILREATPEAGVYRDIYIDPEDQTAAVVFPFEHGHNSGLVAG